jgi:hypothetical protein
MMSKPIFVLRLADDDFDEASAFFVSPIIGVTVLVSNIGADLCQD